MTSVKLTNTTNSPFAVVDINGRSVVFHVNKPVEGDFSGDSLNELFALKSSFGYESAIQSASFKKYNSISFFGDSITNGANASDDAHKWVGLIAGLHGAATVRNKGNSGTVLQNSADSAFTPKTGNGRDSFGAALLGSNKSDAVYIAYGFNDMRYVGYPVNFNKDNYTKDYRELLTGLIVGGYNPEDIYIFSPYYITDAGITTGSTGWAGQTRLKIKEYVDATRSVAIEFGCNYFEMYDSLNSLTWINDVNSNDKIHPSNIGHAMIRDVVKKGGGAADGTKVFLKTYL